jgi:hypothetical protein
VLGPSSFVVLLVALTACDLNVPSTPTPLPTFTPRPVTRYDSERLGVKATLPGTEWELVSGNVHTAQESEETLGEILGSKGLRRDLLFVVWHLKNIPASDAREMTDEEVLDLFETEFTLNNFYEPPQVSSKEFRGYKARRVEGMQSKYLFPPNYHLVLYFFFPDETSVYMIGAGSKTADWETGGKGEAEAILESVEIK